ncbi:MAG: J domain-containing protein [Nitrosopumilaceae archaeon]|nr:J domain-containing protein [Nitrosopumilaceae archaeon]
MLGVSRDAGADEIKSQYRKLALKFHPDRNKSDEAPEHFKEISEAYAVLSDTQKRQLYDQGGHAGISGQYSQEDIFGGMGGGINDIFQNIFGGMGGMGGGVQRGADIIQEVTVSLEDILQDKEVSLNVTKDVACESCGGSGCSPGTSKRTCGRCGGRGQTQKTRRMGFASFVTAETCRNCRGTGATIQKPCRNCRGEGIRRGVATATFMLPKGIDTGNYRIEGQGNTVPHGMSGDLIVSVKVRPHPQFRRDGADLYHDRHITMVDAALGGKFQVSTLEGTETIKIDAGCQSSTIIKMGGKGLPRMGSWGRGDLYARIVVDIPKKMNRRQKELLREFQAESN